MKLVYIRKRGVAEIKMPGMIPAMSASSHKLFGDVSYFFTRAISETKWSDLFEEAKEYETKEEYEKAIDLLLQALTLNPDSPYLNTYIGQMYSVRMFDYLSALPYYEKAYELGYDKKWQHIQTIKANFLAGNYFLVKATMTGRLRILNGPRHFSIKSN